MPLALANGAVFERPVFDPDVESIIRNMDPLVRGAGLPKLFASVDDRPWLHDDADGGDMLHCSWSWRTGDLVEFTGRRRNGPVFYSNGGRGPVREREVKLTALGRRVWTQLREAAS